MSDHIKAFIDAPQWSKHIKHPQLKLIKRANLFQYVIILKKIRLNVLVLQFGLEFF